jgi:chemotaxis family two-component system sensor kinase Cph1
VIKSTIDFSTIDLENCHQEPIHVPGFIQPHGVLAAFNRLGQLTHASRNASSVLPGLFVPGTTVFERCSKADGSESLKLLWDAIASVLQETAAGQETAPLNLEISLEGALYDAVLHFYDERLIVELERRPALTIDLVTFSLLAHRSMAQLRNRKDIAALLAEAVTTVRHLTGFDRVMAYRFHPDDSGEVVTEECKDGLEPFLGRRFPASDIPVQARALYLRNPLRLIADVNDEQVLIEALDLTEQPLDLSHAVLRSVSPIHIEYLRNIRVAASMSLSIIVQGRLWGLIACHHGTAHRVPYAVRMTCDVLSHVLSSAVQSAVEQLIVQRRQAAVKINKRLADLLLCMDDFASSFYSQAAALKDVIQFDDAFCAYGTGWSPTVVCADTTSLLLQWLNASKDDLIVVHRSNQLPESLRNALRPFCGLLAICVDRVYRSWIVLMRREQVESIVWSGIPAKLQRMGPLGVRLTPQGSLAEWRQTVEGTAVAWDDVDQAIARDLMEALGSAAAARAVHREMARAQLLAVLGHDLRDPLQTISVMGQLLEQGGTGRQANYGQRITSTIGRMQRLIDEVFEMSKVGTGTGLGLGLDLSMIHGDMAGFIRMLTEDARLTHPESEVLSEIPAMLETQFDPDRMAQVVNNLLNNARNHGVVGEPISVALSEEQGNLVLRVANKAPAIASASLNTLFHPFKSQSIGNARNPGGLGLGLYIASEVAKGHNGTLEYTHDGTHVIFTMSMPKQ